MTRRTPPLLIAAAVLLSGCSATSEIAGVIGGAAAGGATGNPAVGFAVGVGVDAAADYAVKFYGRSRQHAEQDAIADVAAAEPEGAEAPWHIDHTIPIGDEHGDVRVVRVFETPLTTCREIVFSVVDGHKTTSKRDWYDANICRDPDRWHWASAEPAVPRWGFLQ